MNISTHHIYFKPWLDIFLVIRLPSYLVHTFYRSFPGNKFFFFNSFFFFEFRNFQNFAYAFYTAIPGENVGVSKLEKQITILPFQVFRLQSLTKHQTYNTLQKRNQIPYQKAFGWKSPPQTLCLDQKAQRLDEKALCLYEKASRLKCEQILSKKMSPQYRDNIEGRTRHHFQE